jgi:hypothetical protein
MSEPPQTPSPSPAHLHPTTVEIPAIWTPEQALAVFELLDELKEKIWGLKATAGYFFTRGHSLCERGRKASSAGMVATSL